MNQTIQSPEKTALLNVLQYDPINDENNLAKLSLTNDNSSWIEMSFIPKDLLKYGTTHFDELFSLHPQERHNIVMKGTNNNTEVFRWQRSYLNTPEYDPSNDYFKTHNYMYSGVDTSNNNDNLPNLLVPFYEYVKSIDERYNQVIVNWYESDDYIAFHRDCQRKLQSDVPIVILTLTEDRDACRDFEIIPFEENPASVKTEYSNVKISLRNGLLLKMCGNSQTEFRHGIKQNNKFGRRISISFRAFE